MENLSVPSLATKGVDGCSNMVMAIPPAGRNRKRAVENSCQVYKESNTRKIRRE